MQNLTYILHVQLTCKRTERARSLGVQNLTACRVEIYYTEGTQSDSLGQRLSVISLGPAITGGMIASNERAQFMY